MSFPITYIAQLQKSITLWGFQFTGWTFLIFLLVQKMNTNTRLHEKQLQKPSVLHKKHLDSVQKHLSYLKKHLDCIKNHLKHKEDLEFVQKHLECVQKYFDYKKNTWSPIQNHFGYLQKQKKRLCTITLHTKNCIKQCIEKSRTA